jgi:hypothetical protein
MQCWVTFGRTWQRSNPSDDRRVSVRLEVRPRSFPQSQLFCNAIRHQRVGSAAFLRKLPLSYRMPLSAIRSAILVANSRLHLDTCSEKRNFSARL